MPHTDACLRTRTLLNRRVLLGAMTAASLLPAVARAQAEKQTVRFVWGGDGLHFLLMHVAERGGFFTREGLTPDVVNVPSGNLQVSAILGRSADVAPVGFTGVMQARARGAPIVAVANIFNVISMDIVLSKAAMQRTGITPDMSIDEKVARLKGLRIGITAPGSGSDFLLRTMLRARSIDPDAALRIQPLGDGPTLVAALEKGATDGFVWMSPSPEIAVAKGIGEIAINPFSGEIPEINGVPYIVVATSRDTLGAKPEMVTRVLTALEKAAQFVRERPNEVAALVRGAFPDVDPTILDTALKTYITGIPNALTITKQQFDKTLAWMNTGAKPPLHLAYGDVVAPVLPAKP